MQADEISDDILTMLPSSQVVLCVGKKMIASSELEHYVLKHLQMKGMGVPNENATGVIRPPANWARARETTSPPKRRRIVNA
jgi:hypothetical protein